MPASVVILFVAEALVVFACFAAVPYFQAGGEIILVDEIVWPQTQLATGLVLLGLYLGHLYDDLRIQAIPLLQQLVVIIGMTFLAQSMLGYWTHDLAMLPSNLFWGSGLAIMALFFGRVLFGVAIRNEVGARRVLFVGSSPTATHLAGHFRNYPEFGFTPVGPTENAATNKDWIDRGGQVDSVSTLPGLIDEYRPDSIVVGQDSIDPWQVDDFVELRFGGVHTEQAASLYERTLGRICAAEIRPAELIFADILRPNSINNTLQSIYANAIALIILLITLPISALVAVLIKLSGEPVLLREKRIGMNNVEFTMYTFHWMGQGGKATTTGRFLRYFKLEVLPRFWNVLRGEMSLVGPCPDRPEFAAELQKAIPFHSQRMHVKPGLTGWAQVNDLQGSGGPDALKRLEYDLYYVKNMSPSLDLSVILRWLKGVLRLASPPVVLDSSNLENGL